MANKRPFTPAPINAPLALQWNGNTIFSQAEDRNDLIGRRASTGLGSKPLGFLKSVWSGREVQ